jgi:3',5'-cyclic AMP phosphodiesterase CpdA
MSTPWIVDRRDFLKIASAALTGFLTGCVSKSGSRHPNGRAGVRFGMLTDMHYADAPAAGSPRRYYRQSLDKTREAVATLRAQKPDFLVVLGDMKDMVSGEADTRTLAYLVAIEAEIQQFRGPTYHALGNHDMDNLSKQQVLANISNTGINPARAYYAFSRGGIRFVTLDACCLKDGRDYDHNNFDWRQAYVPGPQLNFLRAELKASREPVIVFSHQRLDGSSDECVRNSAELRTILESSGKVLAAFHGHDHKGGHRVINGIHYYTLIAVVEGSGEANNAYALAEVRPDLSVAITGYRRAVSIALPASV